METMKIGGQEYLVIGTVRIENLGLTLPVVDLPMMSDERWKELEAEGRRRAAV